MKYQSFLLFCCLAFFNNIHAQTQWHNPIQYLQGQGNSVELGQNYFRLPTVLEQNLRPEVWALAKNTAGLYVEFKSDAQKISVRYTTEGMRAMNHMPATGVSGIDLYIKNKNKWDWSPGKYSFKDTITYTFNHLPKSEGVYRLYLPLYTGVKWMEIGVDDNRKIEFVSPKVENPVVIYGSSIAQGGCASRPGLAWPAIFSRKINQQVINLGFSGNGRLEQPILEEMAKIKAKLYILDCIPNLGDAKLYPEEELRKRIKNAVEVLQEAHPQTPILLVEHSGGNTGEFLDLDLNNGFNRTSQILNKVYKEMQKAGKKNLHLLTTKEIGFTTESTVDGSHPNDLGMMQNAEAVEKAYKKIFK